MTISHDEGLDGLDRFVLHVLVERARQAHGSLLPPPSADLVQFRLETMKIGVAHGERGGERELL